MKNIDYSLYLVTDRNQPAAGTFEKVVEEALKGGVTLVQLREKEGDTGLLYERAVKLKKITDAFHVPLIIDDRIDIMLASGADGVHVGQSDMPAAMARKLIGPDKILGVSAGTLEEAVQAEKDGAARLLAVSAGAQEQLRAAKRLADEQAQAFSAELNKTTAEQCAALEQAAKSHADAAASMIVERIWDSEWQS